MEVPSEAIYCPNCGSKLAPQYTPEPLRRKEPSPEPEPKKGNGKIKTAAKIFGGLFLIIIFAVIVIGILEDGGGGGGGGGSEHNIVEDVIWKDKSEVIKDMAFNLGARAEKDIEFPVDTGSGRNHQYIIALDASGNIVLEIYGWNGVDWELIKKNEGVSNTTEYLDEFGLESYSRVDVRIFNTSINIFTSKEVNVKISHSWEKRVLT